MEEWAKTQESNNIFMLPDGNGAFTEQMGMLVDKSDLNFGKRSWRYSMLVRRRESEVGRACTYKVRPCRMQPSHTTVGALTNISSFGPRVQAISNEMLGFQKERQPIPSVAPSLAAK